MRLYRLDHCGRWRMRLIIAVMLAVVSSMTLHHSAMASQFSVAHHQHQDQVHHDNDCGALACEQQHHTLPECCGMGLCLAALPGPAATTPPDWNRSPHHPLATHVDVNWPIERLDRPPRHS